jgi:hypothetical protein
MRYCFYPWERRTTEPTNSIKLVRGNYVLLDLGAVRSQRWFTACYPSHTAMHEPFRGAGQASQAVSGSDGCRHLISPLA